MIDKTIIKKLDKLGKKWGEYISVEIKHTRISHKIKLQQGWIGFVYLFICILNSF